MFAFPTQAFYGKKITKEKIYQYASPTAGVKQQFVRQIDKIIWQYKLAPETINILATKHLAEIQVVDIYLKGEVPPSLNETLLRVIDKAISMPLYYRIYAGEQQCYCMAFKRPNEADSGKWVVDAYFSSPWISAANIYALPIPVALNMQGLYELLLRSVIAEPAQPGESLVDQIARLNQVNSVNRQLGVLTAQLLREKQFNRQIEVNRQINHLKSQLELLSAGSSPKWD